MRECLKAVHPEFGIITPKAIANIFKGQDIDYIPCFTGCPICFSPFVVSHTLICSNPDCNGWEESPIGIFYRKELIYEYYVVDNEVAYKYTYALTSKKEMNFYKNLYHRIVKAHNFESMKFICSVL